MDARQRATFMRAELVSLLAQEAGALAAEPDPGKDVGKLLHTLGHLEDACRATITTLHTSSHVMYAERDLPDDEASDWKRAQHSLRIARLLYAPQAPECPDPGHHADPPQSRIGSTCEDMQ